MRGAIMQPPASHDSLARQQADTLPIRITDHDQDVFSQAMPAPPMSQDEDLTQKTRLTQDLLDPRRLGRHNSGFSEEEMADIICVLHPSSTHAIRIVENTARMRKQHILQNNALGGTESQDLDVGNEAETMILGSSMQPKDIALRFSSRVNDPVEGFCFGRQEIRCDINLDPDRTNKRISNLHFKIFYNRQGSLMIEDLSTNGTVVDTVTLGGRRHPNANPTQRMLQGGSLIEILCPEPDEVIKFVVRIPPREGCEEAYVNNFREYMHHVDVAADRRRQAREGHLVTEAAARRVTAAPFGGPPNSRALPPSIIANKPGMKWSGDGRYNCVGTLGKGAFAVVYQVATVNTGDLYAAKELEKKRFVKNGILDTRIDNEMQIMQGLHHPHIVRYIEYAETKDNLYIIMEFVPGGDLQGYLASHGTLLETKAKDMSVQLLSALAYLHERNITHRDIKPDNILLGSEDPFITKLTDFGLSKVVKNNETFLKTFCGTLLYCAPEVFPHYSSHMHNNKGQKRRRGPAVKRHSYSQLVDIWSYAAVLWTALCGRPPFEGIMDHNGRAMFDRIMSTSLDTTPLERTNISKECINLLIQMLDVDPSTRPSELECLAHPWLNPDARFDARDELISIGLAAIQEEPLEGDQAVAPSYNGHMTKNEHDGSDESSSFGDIARSHLAKRFKSTLGDGDMAPDLARQDAVLEANLSDLPETEPIPYTDDFQPFPNIEPIPEVPSPRNMKLFGEISQGALKSSGALGRKMLGPVIPNSSSPAQEDMFEAPNLSGNKGDDVFDRSTDSRRPGSSRSLGGAEDMVRDLHMTSLEHSVGAPSLGQPVTPNGSHNASQAFAGEGELLRTPRDTDQTPKAAPVIRQAPPSSRQSVDHDGHTESSGQEQAEQRHSSNPTDAAGPQSFRTANESTSHQASANELPQAVSNKASTDYGSTPSGMYSLEEAHSDTGTGGIEFPKPLPRLGRLVSTSDSFVKLTLTLSSLFTDWGRHPANTIVYRDGQDIRIPKTAFDIVFHRDTPYQDTSGTENRTDEEIIGSPELENLQAYIHPRSRNGVVVNGVQLSERGDDNKKLYGKLFHGDEIVVSRPKPGMRLAFVAEIFHGKGKVPRAQPGFVVQKG